MKVYFQFQLYYLIITPNACKKRANMYQSEEHDTIQGLCCTVKSVTVR